MATLLEDEIKPSCVRRPDRGCGASDASSSIGREENFASGMRGIMQSVEEVDGHKFLAGASTCGTRDASESAAQGALAEAREQALLLAL